MASNSQGLMSEQNSRHLVLQDIADSYSQVIAPCQLLLPRPFQLLSPCIRNIAVRTRVSRMYRRSPDQTATRGWAPTPLSKGEFPEEVILRTRCFEQAETKPLVRQSVVIEEAEQ